MKKTILFFGALSCLALGKAQTVNFPFTGDFDSLQVPNCVDSIIVNAWGAQGGTTTAGGLPGKGAYISAKIDVTPGQWIYINVGGQNGYNGGGAGGYGNPSSGSGDFAGNGGGASDVRIGGMTLADRKVVAGGGGGGGRDYVNGSCVPCGVGGDGGYGGITTGGNGFDAINGGYGANPNGGGKGGTQSAGGDGGLGAEGTPGNAGLLGLGGDGINGFQSVASGGGGGGYYGGGAGAGADEGSGVAGSGGGGGSSYFDPATVIFVNGVDGIRNGNGQITISYIISAPIMTTAVGTIDENTIHALQSGVSYQWLNCGTGYSVIPGATSQSFTATANGSYAVELDNGNGCVDTSSCLSITHVGLSENADANVSIFPNPAHENVQVTVNTQSTDIRVQVYDAEGRLVLQSQETNASFTVNISGLENGLYILQISTDETLISKTQLVKN